MNTRDDWRISMVNDDVVSVVERLIEAENNRDADAAAGVLATDFAAITRARGVEQDRDAMLQEVANPKTSVERRLETDTWVRQSGDLAVVRSIVEVIDESSPPGLTRFRNVHVLTRQDQAWKCLAWQVTKLT